MQNIHILGISGSLKPQSSNRTILKEIKKMVPSNIIFNIYEDIASLPYFNPSLDNGNLSEAVTNFRNSIQLAHGIVICSPEYAYGMPGALKNALDWTLSTGEFKNKPVISISTSASSTGGEKALASLLLTLEALSAYTIKEACHVIPFIKNRINPKKELTDPQTLDLLRKSLERLTASILSR